MAVQEFSESDSVGVEAVRRESHIKEFPFSVLVLCLVVFYFNFCLYDYLITIFESPTDGPECQVSHDTFLSDSVPPCLFFAYGVSRCFTYRTCNSCVFLVWAMIVFILLGLRLADVVSTIYSAVFLLFSCFGAGGFGLV